ncbi:uncharacterized protein G2W53_044781 [Senna tora]|uniref:Uncharacterized protein n=1 Tax=Senna tora TaxID=362788 RepID=A0A834SDC1_9FABA|nr:uncharacterized protein G2W53_044781 [Senna tora]
MTSNTFHAITSPVQNVFRDDMTHRPRDHESYSSIKSTGIPKYNTERSFDLLVEQHA